MHYGKSAIHKGRQQEWKKERKELQNSHKAINKMTSTYQTITLNVSKFSNKKAQTG